jgi:hypothetical protein
MACVGNHGYIYLHILAATSSQQFSVVLQKNDELVHSQNLLLNDSGIYAVGV